MEIIGLIPAGGVASRLGRIPCSKEIFPIHFTNTNDSISVVSENLIHCFKKADISTIYFIIRRGKWDIPNYFGDGSQNEVNIGYLMVNLPHGTAFTLDQAQPFVKDKIVALGFPDIFFEPGDAYAKIIDKLRNTNSDLVLGIFPIENYLKWDMVEFDENSKVKNIVIKQDRPDLKFGWTIVVWKPSFTEFLHSFLKEFILQNPDGMFKIKNNAIRELYVGDIIQAAISKGMHVDYVKFKDGSSLDIGTPDDLYSYMRNTLK